MTELSRRDVTIGDRSGKSVVLTLWGDNAVSTASKLDGQEGRATIQVGHARGGGRRARTLAHAYTCMCAEATLAVSLLLPPHKK